MTDEFPPKKYKFIKDRFVNSRDGNSHFLDLYCAKCNAHLLLYQKDGIGSLMRLYLDRIFAPADKANWQFLDLSVKKPNLTCPNCAEIIGTAMIYEPENRPAIRLQKGAFGKKKSNGTYPPAAHRKTELKFWITSI